VFKVFEQISPGEKAVMSKAQQLERRQKRIEQNVLAGPEGPAGTPPRELKMPLNSTMDRLNQGVYVRADQLSEWDKASFERAFKALDDYGRRE
jgi:hypothetical protein